MEAVVVDAGSKLLKAGFTVLDQASSMLIPTQMKCTLEDGPLIDSSLFGTLLLIQLCEVLLEIGMPWKIY